MRFDVITIFPEMLRSVTGYGITGRAVEKGILRVECWNPRDYAEGEYRAVDDRPYGGGPGMVMMAAPLEGAIRAIRNDTGCKPLVIHLSPQGELVDQSVVEELAGHDNLVLLAGRYEGVDERVVHEYVDREYSIGNYVISGGELAAMVIVDAVARQLPGVLGNEDSAGRDSFVDGLLDCPHYTRPEEWNSAAVPEVLLSGNHGAIEEWRLQKALGRTWRRRPDLLAGRTLDERHQRLLDEYIAETAGDGSAAQRRHGN